MVFPLLPSFLLTILHGSQLYLGLIEGAAESLASCLKLASGSISDSGRGRKPYIVVGYTIAALCRPMTALLGSPWQLLVIRLSDRAGKGIRAAPRDAMIVDSTEPSSRGRAFGFQRSMDHLGAAVGPMLATSFLLFFPGELRILFALTLIPGLMVVALIIVGLRETRTASDEVSSDIAFTRRDLSAIAILQRLFPLSALRDRSFRMYLLAVLVFTLSNATDAFLLVRAEEWGIPLAWIPLLWCVFHLFKSYLSIPCGRAIDRFGAKRLLLAGWLVYSLAYLGFAMATQIWQGLLVVALYAVFYGLAEPAERAMVATLCPPQQRGAAFGWFNAAIGIGALPASLGFGWLYQNLGAEFAFGSGACLSLVAAILLVCVTTPQAAPLASASKAIP